MDDKRKRPAIGGFEFRATGKVFGHTVKAGLTDGPAGRPLAQVKIHHPDDEEQSGHFSMTALQDLIRELQCLKKNMKLHNKASYKN